MIFFSGVPLAKARVRLSAISFFVFAACKSKKRMPLLSLTQAIRIIQKRWIPGSCKKSQIFMKKPCTPYGLGCTTNFRSLSLRGMKWRSNLLNKGRLPHPNKLGFAVTSFSSKTEICRAPFLTTKRLSIVWHGFLIKICAFLSVPIIEYNSTRILRQVL